jgi:hypothetical protein
VLRTVWMIDAGGWRPRLITAYPARGGGLDDSRDRHRSTDPRRP